MSERILITGGAGFVGSHLADKLLQCGYRVRILDNLVPQVHSHLRWPDYLNRRVEKLQGDIRDKTAVRQALQDVDAVFHFSAAVGVGQSMYEIVHYTQVNNGGTALLLQTLAEGKFSIKKLVVASSMDLYGEGAYVNGEGEMVEPPQRPLHKLRAGQWELSHNGEALTPVATPESKTPAPSSVYALSKYDQEKLCLLFGQAYDVEAAALRLFNVYGTRQSLSNPYAGVLAIFSSRYLNNRAPVIFEDGKQRRDFVSVHDVTEACLLALESKNIGGEAFNIGSGNNYSILEIAETAGRLLGKEDIEPEVSGNYRVGDIRHCFADIGKARRQLGYEPRVSLEQGLSELAEWLTTQPAQDGVDRMYTELQRRRLIR